MKMRCDKIIVTGGGSGIGYAIAEKLVSLGAQVTITGRTEAKLREAVDKLGKAAHYHVADVSNISAHAPLLAYSADVMGGLDGLVNSAGKCAYTREWGNAVFEQTEEDWDGVMATNVKAPFFLSRAFVRYLLDRQRQGNVLNVVSEAAFQPASASYGASKHALRAITAGMASMFIGNGIVINGIAPGTTATDFVDVEKELKHLRQKNGRLGTPEEMAELAAFLMSREGENIVGQTILSCGASTI